VEVGIDRLTLLALILDGQDLLALHRLVGHQGILSPTGSDHAGGSKIFIGGRQADDGHQDDDPQTDAGAADPSETAFPPITSVGLVLPVVMPVVYPEQGI
jgi:hypothetical protein